MFGVHGSGGGSKARSGAGADGGDAGTTIAASASAAPKAAAPKLSPDPPPRIAARASEAPQIEADLLADKTYQVLWDEKHRDERNLVLTAVSEALISERPESDNVQFPEKVADALERKKLINPVIKLIAYLPRTGTLPSDFVTRAKAFFSSIEKEPHRGLWAPAKAGTPPIDFAALAYWLNPEDASLLREFITARNDGPIKWENAKDPTRPYLVREKVALKRLAQLTTLEPGEEQRLADLKASPLGDDPPDDIKLSEMLSEYGSNEIRADDKFKGHIVEFGGVAGALERGTIGGITLAIGTGKQFEHPVAHCFFDDNQTKKVKELNRGDRIRVRGKVDGLMMNVIIRHCEIVD